jgi:prefoldin subunit 5
MDNQKLIELSERLLAAPAKIMELQTRMLSFSDDIREISADITVMENEIKSEILSSVDSSGKKVFTNAESRDAAFVERSNDNQALIRNKEKLTTIKDTIEGIKIEIEFINSDQRNIRTVLDFFSRINA